jgi:arabinose-5-phosphate isomerase
VRPADPKSVFEIEANAISALGETLDDRFWQVVDLIQDCSGRIVWFGVGKSGHIARKLAATMASVGIHAYFLHAGECHHGDIGRLAPDDVMIAVSYGGESEEVISMLPVIKSVGATLVAMTGKPDSTLGRNADIILDIGPDLGEGLAGWTRISSLAASLAMGDALAIAVGTARGITRENYTVSHPGGSFGKGH